MSIKINPKYKPLYSAKTRYIYLSGGRGSAKSFTVSDFALRLTYEVGHKILYVRYTMTAAAKSIIPEFIEKMEINGTKGDFNVTQDRIINKKTGSEIIFSGIKTSSGNQTASLKSIQGITTLIYEEFEEHPDEDSFNVIDLSIRQKGIQNRIIMLSNAIHMDSWQYKRFFEQEKDITHIHTTYLDNIHNLDESFLRIAESTKESNLERYNKDFLGQHYRNLENALWTRDMILRGSSDHYDRIIVALDPAVTSNKDSDETGIIVVARRGQGGYVLEDRTGKYKPEQWAKIAVSLYNKYKADRIVGEVNNGGDMIESVLRQVDKTVYFKQVRASRGKATRAEPVVALYQQGLIFHTKTFTELEHQMVTWNYMEDKFSPDRVDALVWGMSELFLKNNSGWVL
jgi:phage terminase large subunit